MKVYTKGGDSGFTSLIGGKRVAKYDTRVEAYGSVDELCSFLGYLYDLIDERASAKSLLEREQRQILDILRTLMNVQAIFATEKAICCEFAQVTSQEINVIEQSIDSMSEMLPKTFQFTLPCGDKLISTSHICRTIARRAERVALATSQKHPLPENSLIYLNRLSDYLFVLSRYIAVVCEKPEIWWRIKDTL